MSTCKHQCRYERVAVGNLTTEEQQEAEREGTVCKKGTKTHAQVPETEKDKKGNSPLRVAERKEPTHSFKFSGVEGAWCLVFKALGTSPLLFN